MCSISLGILFSNKKEQIMDTYNSKCESQMSLAKQKKSFRDFPGGTVHGNLSVNAGDTGLIPGPGRSHMPRSK